MCSFSLRRRRCAGRPDTPPDAQRVMVSRCIVALLLWFLFDVATPLLPGAFQLGAVSALEMCPVQGIWRTRWITQCLGTGVWCFSEWLSTGVRDRLVNGGILQGVCDGLVVC